MLNLSKYSKNFDLLCKKVNVVANFQNLSLFLKLFNKLNQINYFLKSLLSTNS